jgi:hypothetical protein
VRRNVVCYVDGHSSLVFDRQLVARPKAVSDAARDEALKMKQSDGKKRKPKK